MALTCKQAPQAERATQLQGMGSLNVAQAQEAGPARGSARHHHQPDQSVRTDGVTDRAPLSYPLSYLATTGTSFSNLRLVGWFVGHQKAT